MAVFKIFQNFVADELRVCDQLYDLRLRLHGRGHSFAHGSLRTRRILLRIRNIRHDLEPTAVRAHVYAYFIQHGIFQPVAFPDLL